MSWILKADSKIFEKEKKDLSEIILKKELKQPFCKIPSELDDDYFPSKQN